MHISGSALRVVGINVMSFHSLNTSNSTLPVSKIVHNLPRLLVPLALLLTTYLYLYPVFLGCVFPSTDHAFVTAFSDTVAQHVERDRINPLDTRPQLAPFRLLVLADPQLEGDSSLPQPEDSFWSRTRAHWARLTDLELDNVTNAIDTVREVATEFVVEDIPGALQAARKRLDLFGNDYYLAHIFRTLHWWTKPTHVTVLGDLIGSQWVDDEEFEWRGWRYWNRVFAGGTRVEDQIMEMGRGGGGLTVQMDDPRWRTSIVNIAGNHDIGYAGDISSDRIRRFEEMYGKANWDLKFEYPASRLNASTDGVRPVLHLVVLNSMLLDTPALDEALQSGVYDYLNGIARDRVLPVEDRSGFTLVLTHVPLYKQEGICVDAPLFTFQDDDDDCSGDCRAGGLKEQNHLSEFASRPGMLSTIFGMSGDLDAPVQGRGRPGLILNGHDHEGCDVWHYIPDNSTFRKSEPPAQEDGEHKTVWDASKWKQVDIPEAHTGIREVTLRSMMGEFGGNAGLLSAWFDFGQGEWQYDIKMCKLGVQHFWWAVHVIDIIAIWSLLLSCLLHLQQSSSPRLVKQRPGGKSMKVE